MADDNVDHDVSLDETYLDLNRRFYDAEPAAYFETRLFGLMVLAARPDAVRSFLADGLTHAGLTLKVEASDVDPVGIGRHVAIESQVLLHHVSESLIRLFLAHVELPSCPWVEIANERSPSDFKERVKTAIIARTMADGLLDDVKRLFMGRRTCPPQTEQHEWDAASNNLTTFLVALAERWHADANIYNSLKHGLSALPGESSFTLTPDGEEPRALADGTSVEFLETGRSVGGKRLWQLATKWLDVGESLALAHIACRMTESLWAVAKHHYLGTGTGHRFFFPVNLTPSHLRTGQPTVEFRRHLFEEFVRRA